MGFYGKFYSRFFGGFFGSVATESGPILGAPDITLISPSDFDVDYSVATVEPVVINVTDPDGLRDVTITVTGEGFTGTQVVYIASGFVDPFTSRSTAPAITNGKQFHILPLTGWRTGTLAITVQAVDVGGNFGTATFNWVLPAATEITDNTAGPFPDSTWRWRRRLNRGKCSVISVAIEDNYSDGPGFTLTALALEIAKKKSLDRTPWRGGTYTNTAGSGNLNEE